VVRLTVEHHCAERATLMTTTLGELVHSARAILFDFDGPICHVFSGLPAPRIAAQLIRLVESHGASVSITTDTQQDPLAVLQHVAKQSPTLVNPVEDALCAAELAAVAAAEPTPGSAASVRACVDFGKSAAIVSNNSEPAVREYLVTHDMVNDIDPIIGRPYGEPARMKPSPEPIYRALDVLGLSSADALLVGDSPSDIEACKAAGVRSIGYANKPHKWASLADADAVIDDMADLADAICQVSK
jgi:phosphoglycolate phosphatase-like HAD superfamily hydrolase